MRGIHQCGSLAVADEHAYYQRDHTPMPKMAKAIDPKEIVERARGKCVQLNPASNDDPQYC